MSRAERHREWEARVAEFRASGMGARKWCMEHGVKVKQLYYWLKKFREADPLPGAAAQWVLVTLVSVS